MTDTTKKITPSLSTNICLAEIPSQWEVLTRFQRLQTKSQEWCGRKGRKGGEREREGRGKGEGREREGWGKGGGRGKGGEEEVGVERR